MMKLNSKIPFSILLAVLIISCSGTRSRTDDADFLSVIRVVDGDTFVADDGTIRGVTIRLIGVDSPESRNSGLKRVGEYGMEAKVFLTEMLAGKMVRLEFDVSRKDQYRRTLAYVYLPDGTFVNAEMVRKGYATVMTIPPNVKHAEEFLKLERQARRQGRGLWHSNSPTSRLVLFVPLF
jgi:micrococcal nuclease